MNDKMKSIKQLANDAQMTEDTCNNLLGEFHSACVKDSCSDPNEHLSQLSVDDVCAAVDTKSKLKIEPMGKYFDFRNYAVQGKSALVFYCLIYLCVQYEVFDKYLSASFGLRVFSFDCLFKPHVLTEVTIISLHLHKR